MLRFLCFALSLFLLLTPCAAQDLNTPQLEQEPNHLEALPPVGSDAALESQKAFREWNAMVTQQLQPHFLLDYQAQFHFSFQTAEWEDYSNGSV